MSARTPQKLLFAASSFLIASYEACNEGFAHDQSGCVIDLDLPAAFLGFQYWTNIGIALGAVGFGLVIGVGKFAFQRD